ncbi:MAG: NADH-quinone oxidoreductase subunit H [Candidatus Brockarchaeota archaeon]|nr:NADH-quinone oxidoreductase subunit H [Candidatus Brockarchaeota archaeon]
MAALAALLASLPAAVFLSLLFEGIDRKLHARMQGRIGPPVTQPFYDFAKLLNKESVFPSSSSKAIFASAPVIAAASSILAGAIPLASLVAGTSVVGDLILILYLLTMSSIMVMIGGSSSGNPYGAIGFSRKMVMLIGYEVPLLASILPLSLKSQHSFSYHGIVQSQVGMGTCFAFAYPSSAFAAAAFLACIPAAAGVVPFDVPEAKTEIVHGYLVEYGGPHLALARLAKDAASFALSFLALTLFFYHPPLFEGHASLGGLASAILCVAFAPAMMFLTVTVPRTVFARLKVGQAFKFCWSLPLTLSALSVVLSAAGF